MSSFTNTPFTSTPAADEFDLQREELAKLQQTQQEWFECCLKMRLPDRIKRAVLILGEDLWDNAPNCSGTKSLTRGGLTISHNDHQDTQATYNDKTVFSWGKQFCALNPETYGGPQWLIVFEELELEATQADAEWKEKKRADELASLKAEVSSLKEKLGFTQEAQ